MKHNDTFPLPQGITFEEIIGCNKCGALFLPKPIPCQNSYCEKFKVIQLSKEDKEPAIKEESQEELFTKNEVLDLLAAYSVCPRDYSVEETKREFPHQFKGKRKEVLRFINSNIQRKHNG